MKAILFALLLAIVCAAAFATETDETGVVNYIDLPFLPVLIDTSYPCYPDSAYKAKVEGAVIVSIIIDEEGNVTDAEIQDSRPEKIFDQVALDAASGCRFEPIEIDGRPVKVKYHIPYIFKRSYYWLRRCSKVKK